MRIVIAAPYFTYNSGGHIALHKLCDSLIRQGFPAYLKPQNDNKFLTNPNYFSNVTTDFDPDEDVAIYHNTIKGNPWQARKIIRWLLYTPTNELDGVALYYSPQFGSGPILRVIDPQLDIFYDRGLERNGECWAWRKARRQGWPENKRPKTGLELNNYASATELADIFNTTTRFTCYDGASFLSIQAALCGCDSIVPKPVGGYFAWPGIATTESGIKAARAQHSELRQMLEHEYADQDKKVALVMNWALSQLGD